MAAETGARHRAPAVPLAEVIDGLNDLLRLDHDAVSSYEIAIEKLANREYALSIERFKDDHLAHIRRLNDAIVQLGGKARNEPHATEPLKEALLKVGAAGGDRGILLAWRANELQAMVKYDRYAHRAVHWPAEVKRVVDENALDEERHYGWVVGVLGGADPEVDLTNRLRERIAAARAKRDAAVARAARAGEAARATTAGFLAAAAGRFDASRPGSDGLDSDGAARGRPIARGLDATAAALRGDPDRDISRTIADGIRANFGRSIAVAFGAGFIIGRLIR